MRALPTFEYKGRTYIVDPRLEEVRDELTAEPTALEDCDPAMLQAALNALHVAGRLTDLNF